MNYSCGCKKCFIKSDQVMMLMPCEHFIHERCLSKLLLKNKKNCLLCKKEFINIVSENVINKNKIYKQNKVDLLSIKLSNTCEINYMLLPIAIVNFNAIVNQLMMAKTINNLNSVAENFIRLCNIKIKIIDKTNKHPIIYKDSKIQWTNPEDEKKNIIILSNHTTYIDSMIMYYLFKCGFVAADFINSFDIGRLIVDKLDLLVFKRNSDTNTVEKIKEYLKERKRITLFPEGTLSNQDTLLEFRTGAFYTEGVICPIVIKYDPVPYDDDMTKYIFKAITQSEINVSIIINDLQHPPFDKVSIAKVRNIMAKSGNLLKSRVSNKTIVE